GQVRQEDFPDTSVAKSHGVARAIPTVELAYNADDSRVRRPSAKSATWDSFAFNEVCAERPVAFVVGAFAMEVQFKRREERRETIGVLQILEASGVKFDAKKVGLRFDGEHCDIEAAHAGALHRNGLFVDDQRS